MWPDSGIKEGVGLIPYPYRRRDDGIVGEAVSDLVALGSIGAEEGIGWHEDLVVGL